MLCEKCGSQEVIFLGTIDEMLPLMYLYRCDACGYEMYYGTAVLEDEILTCVHCGGMEFVFVGVLPIRTSLVMPTVYEYLCKKCGHTVHSTVGQEKAIVNIRAREGEKKVESDTDKDGSGNNLGKCIVTPRDDFYFIEYPDGDMAFEPTKERVKEKCLQWFRYNKLFKWGRWKGIGQIEWRMTENYVVRWKDRES
jgi:hypothetical protein